MKKAVFRVLKPVAHVAVSLFFDRKYLSGRYFSNSFGGYVWAFRAIWARNILRLAQPMPWPVALGCTISDPRNLEFDPDDLNNFQTTGTYFQCRDAKIVIGKGTYIAPNVGLITSNHDISNPELHVAGQDIVLGVGCWIGMNSVILPGVHLGDGTVVAAGSVVTKSFPSGSVVLAGSPARVLKRIYRNAMVEET